jgi:hypothetical protein
MDQVDSQITERFLNFQNNLSGSMLTNTAINCIIEKDSMAAESELEKKKENVKGSYYLLNYFDPKIGEYNKIMVKRVKK